MICPQCHNEVPVTEAQYLSMYTCPRCTAVYFIDIVGQPEFNDMSESEKYATDLQNQVATKQKATENHQNEFQKLESENQSHDLEENVFSNPEEVALEAHSDINQLNHDQFDQVLDQTLETSLAPQDVEESSAVDSQDTQSDALNSDQNSFQNPIEAIEDASIFSGAAREISDFGNQYQEIQQMTYDLKVTGLDSKEISALFKEALEDMKLGWLPQDVNSFIKNGECHLSQLSPIQAFIIAKRIQFLDIEMKWTQNAVQ